MALVSAGVAAHEVNAAVRDLVHSSDELPTVADIIAVVKRVRVAAVVAALQCPSCGSGVVAAIGGRVVLCFDCDWEPEQETAG